MENDAACVQNELKIKIFKREHMQENSSGLFCLESFHLNPFSFLFSVVVGERQYTIVLGMLAVLEAGIGKRGQGLQGVTQPEQQKLPRHKHFSGVGCLMGLLASRAIKTTETG